MFPLERIVYLSPDSDTVLSDVDPDNVYMIGGLVDESIQKVDQNVSRFSPLFTRVPVFYRTNAKFKLMRTFRP